MKMTPRTQKQLDYIREQLEEYHGNVDSCHDSVTPTFTFESIPTEGLYVVGLTDSEQEELLSQLNDAVMEAQQELHDRMRQVLEDFYDNHVDENLCEDEYLITEEDRRAGQTKAQSERYQVLKHMVKRLEGQLGLRKRKTKCVA
jgi:hypothetical protein